VNDLRLGIDFGTCFSSVGYHDGQGIQFVKDPAAAQLSYSIPSSVLLRGDGSFAFGELAESERAARPECYQSQFKRDLGSSTPYQLGNGLLSSAAVTEKFLAFLATLSSEVLSTDPGATVITVPATYDQHRRSVVEQAARQAGFSTVTLVAEPVAAVVAAAGRGEVPASGTVLVYDLGGGTFDAAVVRMTDGRHQVLGARGLPDFGGTDIDLLIERDFARKAGDALDALMAGQDSDDPQVRRRGLRARMAAQEMCRSVKHRLSSADEAYGDLNLMLSYELTRAELEAMVRPDLSLTIATCRQLITETVGGPEEISGVLLVGGPCRMPCVRQTVAEELHLPVWRTGEPELAVCLGATLLARSPELELLRGTDEENAETGGTPADTAAARARVDELERGKAAARAAFRARMEGERVSDIERAAQRGAAERVAAREESKADRRLRQRAEVAAQARAARLTALAQSVGASTSRSSALIAVLQPDEEPIAAIRCGLTTFRDLALLVVTNRRVMWCQEDGRGTTIGSIWQHELDSVSREGSTVTLHHTDGEVTRFRTWRDAQVAPVLDAAHQLTSASGRG
jgi:molecular chaperone DnaK